MATGHFDLSKHKDESPPQADFVYYPLRAVSRLNAASVMSKHPESCVCVLVGEHFALISTSKLKELLVACQRSK